MFSLKKNKYFFFSFPMLHLISELIFRNFYIYSNKLKNMPEISQFRFENNLKEVLHFEQFYEQNISI